MTSEKWMHSVAGFLRRAPWVMHGAYAVWRKLQVKCSIGAVGVVINANGQVLLVEHVFHPKLPWGLPGGWVSRGEDPATTVSRELDEELSLHVEVSHVLLAEMPFPRHLDLAYLCHAHGEVGTLSFELLNYGWFSPEQMPRLSGFHWRAIQHALRTQHQREAAVEP